MFQAELARTTKTPSSWESPPPTPNTIESYWIPSQRRQSQSYKFKEFAKISFFLILKQTLHETRLLKLLDKMCKYEMDRQILLKIQSGHDSVHGGTDG